MTDRMTDQHRSDDRGAPPKRGYEANVVSFRAVAWFGIGLLLSVLVVVLVAQVVLDELASRRPVVVPHPSKVQPDPYPPEPRLETLPSLRLEEMRRQEEEILTGYGWVDREEGIARIPIDRAMELLIQRGLPARDDGGDTPAASDRGGR